MATEQYTAERIIEAIQATKGNVSAAAARLRCSRTTLMSYAKKYATVKQALDDERESMIDAAETALHSAILDKQGWAVCFMLKTLGRTRGYVERQEIAGVEDAPIPIVIKPVDYRAALTPLAPKDDE